MLKQERLTFSRPLQRKLPVAPIQLYQYAKHKRTLDLQLFKSSSLAEQDFELHRKEVGRELREEDLCRQVARLRCFDEFVAMILGTRKKADVIQNNAAVLRRVASLLHNILHRYGYIGHDSCQETRGSVP